MLEEAKSLQTELSPADRVKIDQYLTSVRELETHIQNLDGATCTKPKAPTVTAQSPYPDRVGITMDLAALAFECDATRVITFMFGRGGSLQDFSFLLNGESTPHHYTSHHGNDPKLLAKLREIGHWEVDQVARFLKRLDQTQEAGGKTLLDNTLAYFNSEISDGDRHRKADMPIFLAGNAGGKLKVDGSHYMYTQMTFPRPTAGPGGGPHGIKLFVSILNAFGIADQTFGDGSAQGPLTELMV